MSVRAFRGIEPSIHPSCFIEASAQIIGDVQIGEHSSVWFNSVVRGDVQAIRIGKRTNVQDLSIIHVVRDRFGTFLGDDVTVGHHVVLHGCSIGNRVLVGMGATVMDGAVVEEDCLIAAGSLVVPGTKIPTGSLAMGSPAKVRRALTADERAALLRSAANYVSYAAEYAR